MSCKQFLLLIIFSVLLYFNLYAQQTSRPDSLGAFTIPKIDTWRIHSSIIDEDYNLYVLRTEAYDTTNVKLPVLYMTDGDWNMTVAMNCFSMLRQDYVTHEPLVVGIGYGKNENKRSRDLDPKKGAPAFLSFIEKEVMPFIDKTYRTNSERAIYGYSLGGMFTTYILFNRPDLFEKVFIGAPGNNGYDLMPSARKYFKDHSDIKSKVFIGVGSFENEVVRNIDSFTNYLNSKKNPELKLRSDITPNANHGAALAQVMQNAIAFGYCERHRQITIDPSIFRFYKGDYVYYEKSKPMETANVFSKDGKLFLKWNRPTAIPEELLPISKNEFYIPANERLVYTFKMENGKPELIIAVANEAEYRFIKKK